MSGQDKPSFELPGLAAAIKDALKAHPRWARDESARVVCAGPGCDWVKPGGQNIARRWLNHQTFEVQWAVAEWYDEGEEVAA